MIIPLLIGYRKNLLGVAFIAANQALAGMNQREEIWSRAIYMIQDFSFTGIGMGSFTQVADLLYPFFLAAPGKIEHAHNLFLQITVDLGLPGLIAWLSLLMGVIAISWRLVRDGKATGDALYAALGAGLLCSQIALITHGMLDAVTWGMVKPAPLVWALWGIAVAAYLLHESKSMKQKGNIQDP
jgi:putative inorganic carbon (HCO3(-)) transporter